MNNRYKIRISKEPIFWTTNSVNHPHWTLWQSDYLPTFINISNCYINWIDNFTISTILDSSDYTMLELTDTITNNVMYFLAKSISKKLQNGYELIFNVDIYLSFLSDFFQWLQQKDLPIYIKRFLSNSILPEWFKQKKYVQQDNLLNYKNGTAIMSNNSNNCFCWKQSEQIDESAFLQGTYTVQNTFVLDSTINTTNNELYVNTDNINNSFTTPYFYVFENNDGYYYFILNGTNNNNRWTMFVSYKRIDSVMFIENGNCSTSSIETAVLNSDYWRTRFIGKFNIQDWNMIPNWFTTNGNNGFLGFRLKRDSYVNFVKDSDMDLLQGNKSPVLIEYVKNEIAKYININYKGNWYKQLNLKWLGNDGKGNVPNLQNFLNTFYCKIFYNLKDSQIEYTSPDSATTAVDRTQVGLNAIFETFMFINSATNQFNYERYFNINLYFISQSRFINSTLQYCPVPYIWNFSINGFLTFDGNKANSVNNVINEGNIINEGLGTINVSTDDYANYLAQVKPQMNTNLEVMKSQIDLQEQQNIVNSVFSGIGSLGSMATNPLGGFLGLGKAISNGIFTSQNLELQYQNQQKINDTILAVNKLSHTANNISSSCTSDDAICKYINNQTMGDACDINGIWQSNSQYFCSSTLVYFPNNIGDLKFINNLIWKNGFFANMFISTKLAFENDNTKYGKTLNSFMYLDFEIDEDLLRLFKPNLPTDYIEAIKIVINNSVRLWYVKMDIDNMPDYITDYTFLGTPQNPNKDYY